MVALEELLARLAQYQKGYSGERTAINYYTLLLEINSRVAQSTDRELKDLGDRIVGTLTQGLKGSSSEPVRPISIGFFLG